MDQNPTSSGSSTPLLRRPARRSVPRGYTLVELMVIIAIISLLVTIAVPNLLEAETRSRVARARADMQSLVTALTAYSTDYNGAMPPAPADPEINPLWQGSQQFLDNGGFNLTTPIQYITNIPLSPFLHHATPQRPGAGYFFFNYRFHKQRNAWPETTDPCPFAGNAVAAGVEWALWSMGPTKGDPAQANGMVYDPTNGTVSLGQVAYFSDRGLHANLYSIRP